MAKGVFLGDFQINLKKSLEDLIINEWGHDDFIVTCEDEDF